ncbi:hypothetical protein F4819DRAFT_472404 [Hypoxylon fuscum]|nr:hypothetical protein F4819DRAFT_472404 [Hypoxylon fuscum]
MLDPITIVGTALGIACSGVSAAWNVAKIAMELKGVPETTKVFLSILHQVTRDITHAGACYEEIQLREKHNCMQVRWILDVLIATIKEVREFGQAASTIRNLDEPGSPDFLERVIFVVSEYKDLGDRETALRFAHSRLLAAINTIHFMAFQLGSLSNSSLSSALAQPSRRRASPVPPRNLKGTEDDNLGSGASSVVGGEVGAVVPAWRSLGFDLGCFGNMETSFSKVVLGV